MPRDYNYGNDFHVSSDGENRECFIENFSVETNKQFLGEKCHLIIGTPSIIWSSYECILGGIFLNIVNRAIL